jgi:hypothetical protein
VKKAKCKILQIQKRFYFQFSKFPRNKALKFKKTKLPAGLCRLNRTHLKIIFSHLLDSEAKDFLASGMEMGRNGMIN